MATHDYVLDNATGANFRSDLNNALAAIVSNNSSSTEPSTKYAYQWWADTNEGVLKIRNSSNDGWVTLLQLDGTLTLEDGSNSAPALGFRDDLNTGIFSSAADTLDITCGGTTRGSFSSSGLTVTGNVTATTFVGNIDAVDGDFDGTLEADAITVAGVALGTVIAGTTVTTATNANHVSVADNESTNENNLIPFIEDASATGNVGLESDGDFTYNPSTGTVTATAFSGSGASLTALNIVTDTSPQLGGNLDAGTRNIDFDDNGRLRLGTGNDLQLYHNGTDSYIDDVGTGVLKIRSDGGAVQINKTNGEKMADLHTDGSVDLYFDNSKKLETISGGISVTGGINTSAASTFATSAFTGNVTLGDSVKALFGTGTDFEVYHNGTNAIVDNNTGVLSLQTTSNLELNIQSNFRVLTKGGDENCIQGITDGAVELYHDNSKKFETLSDGVNITGTLKVNGSAFTAGGGKVVQQVSVVKTDTASNSTGSQSTWEFNDSSLRVQITGSSTNNKFMFIGQVTTGGEISTHIGLRDGATSSNVTGMMATGTGNTRASTSGHDHGDSHSASTVPIIGVISVPDTNQHTYYYQFSHTSGGTVTLFINRGSNSGDNAERGRYISSLTVLEIEP